MSRPQPDPLIGHRCWKYSTRDGELRSVVRGTVWPAGRKLTAECLRPRPEGLPPCEHPPGDDCGCGIYAWLEPGDVRRLLHIEPLVIPVWGSCSLWGRVHVHESGIRAEHAYPYELRVSEEHAGHVNDLRGRYGVDVVTVPVPEWAR